MRTVTDPRPPATASEVDPASCPRDPAEIYRLSFARARAETPLDHLPPFLHPVVLRIVHACGLPEIARDVGWRGDPVAAARSALAQGAPVLCDTRMTEAGIARGHLPPGSRTLCTLDEEPVPGLAATLGTTRTAAAVELWRPHLEGAVVAIGNAPTALFHLLDRMAAWRRRPAAIFAFPLGFVGARESKRALAETPDAPPFLTLHGRFGGSALAAAALNAVLLAERP